MLSRKVYLDIKAVPSEAHRLSTSMKHSGGKWRLSSCVNLMQPLLKRHEDRIHPRTPCTMYKDSDAIQETAQTIFGGGGIEARR